MDKKKIIIIVVVAVLLYLLYKKGVFSSLLGSSDSTSTDTTGGTSTGSFGVDTNDTASIISGTSMTSALQTTCKGWVRNIEKAVAAGSNGWSKASLVKQAEDNDITYQQQIVLSALWQMYKTAGTLTQKQCNTYSEEVRNM